MRSRRSNGQEPHAVTMAQEWGHAHRRDRGSAFHPPLALKDQAIASLSIRPKAARLSQGARSVRWSVATAWKLSLWDLSW